jgi:hypothetical protein
MPHAGLEPIALTYARDHDVAVAVELVEYGCVLAPFCRSPAEASVTLLSASTCSASAWASMLSGPLNGVDDS